MKKYKILIIILLFIFLTGALTYYKLECKDLEKEIINKEKIISEQDNKLKEQLTEIGIITTDNENKKIIITSLEIRIAESDENCNKVIKDIEELQKIEKKNISKEKAKKGGGVINEESADKYINLRNSIYSRHLQ